MRPKGNLRINVPTGRKNCNNNYNRFPGAAGEGVEKRFEHTLRAEEKEILNIKLRE